MLSIGSAADAWSTLIKNPNKVKGLNNHAAMLKNIIKTRVNAC